jgi:hypothetical protein
MKRLVLVGFVLLASLVFTVPAWGGWIFEDPVLNIGGHRVDVAVMLSLPSGQTVSSPTSVYMLVPRNVKSSIVEPMGCDVQLIPTAPQPGPLRLSFAMVKQPLTDNGHSYPIQVTVSDDVGFTLSVPGRAGAWIVVPYLQWK